MKNLFYPLAVLMFLSLLSAEISFAQPAAPAAAKPATAPKAAPKATDPASPKAAAEQPKVVKPVAFWATTPPEVTGKMEAKYDINGDGILQTSEVKILLRRISAQIQVDNINFNVEDSKFLKAYDKNKDGIISKLELQEIKKDLSY
jgi:hypothetical protein